MSPPSVALYVFSGTGNTRYVADLLARELEWLGLRVATRFARECTLCLHCFYACPEKALTPVLGRWLLIDGWHDLSALARDDAVPADLSNETRGYYRRFWHYVRSP